MIVYCLFIFHIQTSPLAVSDALQGLLSRIRWNKPPKGFEKFFKDKPASAPKPEPPAPKSSTPKEAKEVKEAAPKSSGNGGGSKPAPKTPPKGGAQPDFSKFFKNAKAGGFGGDGDKQKYATMAAVGTGALLLFLFANQMSYKEITWKDFVKTYLAKGHVVR